MTTKPRQDFLGPITRLAARPQNGTWITDGSGVVDGYGSVIKDVSIVMKGLILHPITGAHKGSFWVNDNTNPTLPYFTDSAGNDILLLPSSGGGSEIPTGVLNSVYWSNGITNNWTSYPVVNTLDLFALNIQSTYSDPVHKIQQANGAIVDLYSGGGYGVYVISPKPYDGTTNHAPHHDKHFGSFSLTGPSVNNRLTFSLDIGYDSMPAKRILSGRLLLGWTNTNSYIASSIELLINIVTNSSGNIYRITTNIMGASEYAGPSHPWTVYDLSNFHGAYVLPTGSYFPALSFTVESDTTWSILISTNPGVSSGDIQEFYWSSDWGWGSA